MSRSGHAFASSRWRAAERSFSSSATMHLGMIVHSSGWQRDRRSDTCRKVVSNDEARQRAVSQAQPLAQVLQADAGTRAFTAKTHAVVGHRDRKHTLFDATTNPYAAA